MRFWLGVMLASGMAPSMAADADPPVPYVPAEVMSLQRNIPVMSDSVPFGNYAAPSGISASSSVLGTIGGATVTGIGNAVPVIGPPLSNPNLMNSIVTPRVR